MRWPSSGVGLLPFCCCRCKWMHHGGVSSSQKSFWWWVHMGCCMDGGWTDLHGLGASCMCTCASGSGL